MSNNRADDRAHRTGVDVTDENEQADAVQAVSSANTPVAEDKRAGQRYTLMLRFAKLKGPQGEYLCVLRNVSSRGASVKLFHPLNINGPVEIELANGDTHSADLVWQRDDKAGLSFHHEADLARLIESPSEHPRRGMRVTITLPVELAFGGGSVTAEIHNISQQGALVKCEEHLPLLQSLTVQHPLLPDIRAKVLWRRDGCSGLVFDDTFQYGELARLVDELQRHYADQGEMQGDENA